MFDKTTEKRLIFKTSEATLQPKLFRNVIIERGLNREGWAEPHFSSPGLDERDQNKKPWLRKVSMIKPLMKVHQHCKKLL